MARILFLHGLESGPQGTKVHLLRDQGIEVVAPDQRMSLRRLDRDNSVARNLMRDNEVRLAAATTAAGLLAAPWRRGALALAAAGIGWGVVRHRRWIASATATSRRACAQIAAEALHARPDVLVGSSWGGAVACQLIADGSWTGPTILLAPASRKVQGVIDPAGWTSLADRIMANPEPVHIVHDPADDVVPVGGSRDLTGGSVTLHEVNAGGHRLLPFVEDGRLAELIRSLAPSS